MAESAPTPREGGGGRGEFSLDIPLRYVQALRLAQALMESDYLVHLSEADAEKFSHIQKLFGLRYRVGCQAAVLPDIEIVHDEPRTRIGSIRRTLIFPHSIFAHCQGLWPERRTIRYLFAGLITARRHAALNQWVRRTRDGSRLELPRNDGWRPLLWRKLRQLAGRRRKPAIYKAEFGELVMWASEGGRHFPTKIWHQEYYAQMARAQFVLCPDGEFTWSYRFYESVMCGAIPIVENTCPLYDGFHFATMADDPRHLQWSEEMVHHNYERARSQLTLPKQDLNEEIASLLAAAPGPGPCHGPAGSAIP